MNEDIAKQDSLIQIAQSVELSQRGLSDEVLKERLADQHWTSHNIRLSELLTTMPGQPDFVKTDLRLHAILRILNAFYRGRLNDLSVADLGCLEGGFALVLAQQGADVTGIEARAKNIEKALLLQEHFGLTNLHFVSRDVKDFSPQNFSSFDVTLALGILDHLDCPVEWLSQTAQLTKSILIVDTHFAPATEDDLKKVNKNIASLSKLEKIEVNGHSYEGRWFYEFDKKDDPERHLWASYSNYKSFWLTKESLLLALQRAGFDLVLEQHDYSASFYQYFNTTFPRGMFVAVKRAGLVPHHARNDG